MDSGSDIFPKTKFSALVSELLTLVMFSSSSGRKACPTHPHSIHTGTGETEVEDEWVSRGERGRESDLLQKSSEFGLGGRGRVNERLMDGWREHITQTADAMMQI